MSTPHLEEALSAYLSGELAGPELENAEAHLRECGECRNQLQRLKQVNALLSDAPSIEVPKDFSARVMRRAVEQERPIRFRTWKAVAWAAVAAAVVLAVFLLHLQREVQPPQQMSQKPPVERKEPVRPQAQQTSPSAHPAAAALSPEDRELIAHLDDLQDMELINNYDNLQELDTAMLSQTERLQ